MSRDGRAFGQITLHTSKQVVFFYENDLQSGPLEDANGREITSRDYCAEFQTDCEPQHPTACVWTK